jgi:hypothetical protein
MGNFTPIGMLTTGTTWSTLRLYTKQAKAAGLMEEEAGDAFNSNMMAAGLQSELPLEFTRQHQRAWLVAEYEAGDVVLQKPHGVGETRFL